MAEHTPSRRSGRERKVSRKFGDAGWDKDTLRLLRESSESSGSSPSDSSADEADEEVDQEFDAHPGIDAFSEATSSDSEKLSDASSHSAVATPIESDDDVQPASNTPVRRQGHLFVTAGTLPRPSGTGRSQGIFYEHHNSKKETSSPNLFGPESLDLEPAIRLHKTWLGSRDITVPSRATLSLQKSSSESLANGVNRGNALSPDELAQPQVQHVIDAESARRMKYLVNNAALQSLVLGPPKQQQLFEVAYLQSLDVSKAWLVPLPETTVSAPAASLLTNTQVGNDHRGWILNVGGRVQSLTWLPSDDDNIQLLAIATYPTAQQRNALQKISVASSPAFQATASYPASIQIWSIDSESARDVASSHPKTSSPCLSHVYTLDSGGIRLLLWQHSISKALSGMLAVLTTDGSVRLLKVSLHRPATTETSYMHVEKPAMHLNPPSASIFTSMCWASATDLVVGDSCGAIHLYNIADPPNLNPYLSPYLSLELHSTYIMNIVSNYPSDVPTFIASTSAAGEILLTDLRAPQQDNIRIPKARLPAKPLVYSHLLRAFLTINDTTGVNDPRSYTSSLVVCHHLRRFSYSAQIARLPRMSGVGTALACSPHHPCLLIGNAKGAIFATNYARRALPSAAKHFRLAKYGGYIQQLFEYDWRPAKPSDITQDDVDIFHGNDPRTGISRFIEGFKPQRIDISASGTKPPQAKAKKAKNGSPPKDKDESNTHMKDAKRNESSIPPAADVVYEEEQAVACLEWNPNAKFAGWAAMGWGSGIVRVMDLSHGAP